MYLVTGWHRVVMELIEFFKNDRNCTYNHVSMTHCLWLSHSFVEKFAWPRQSTNRVLLVRHIERRLRLADTERERQRHHTESKRERRWRPAQRQKQTPTHILLICWATAPSWTLLFISVQCIHISEVQHAFLNSFFTFSFSKFCYLILDFTLAYGLSI